MRVQSQCDWTGQCPVTATSMTDVVPLSITYNVVYEESGGCGDGDTLCGDGEGDCNSDDECEGGLVCTQRSADDPATNGYYFSNSDEVNNVDRAWDYCEKKQLEMKGADECNPGSDGIGDCADGVGDCDSDEGCAGNLVCHQREAGDAPPEWYKFDDTTTEYVFEHGDGCGSDGKDLCPSGHGDCDNDDDCEDGLTCVERDGKDEASAGYLFQDSIDGTALWAAGYDYCETTPDQEVGYDYCIKQPLITIVGTFSLGEGDVEDADGNIVDTSIGDWCSPRVADSDGEWISGKPCGPGYGDCDHDEDCTTGSFCLQRDKGDDAPGGYQFADDDDGIALKATG